MTTSHYPWPGFADWLELIEDRSAALRSAAAATVPGARVPGCPDWTVPDLVAHLGGVQRFWAAAVAAGPAPRPPRDDAVPDREPPAPGGPSAAAHGGPPPSVSPGGPACPGVTDRLLDWSARSTRVLLDALRAAGPDAGCWTWWAGSGNPATSGSVARHQVQEAAVHARDAQEAAGAPLPVPSAVAVDAVDEFLHVGFGSMDGWPHSPARVALVADEGVAWTLLLDATGASAVRSAPAGPDAAGGSGGSGGSGGRRPEAGATFSGPASDLLLALYRRVPWDEGALRVDGDRELVRQLVVWPPLG
jgi:uncharacterized protein (TIGR03083 family)